MIWTTRLAHFFCKGPASKYVKICRSHGLCSCYTQLCHCTMKAAAITYGERAQLIPSKTLSLSRQRLNMACRLWFDNLLLKLPSFCSSSWSFLHVLMLLCTFFYAPFLFIAFDVLWTIRKRRKNKTNLLELYLK